MTGRRLLWVILLLLSASGCSAVVSSATGDLADNLSAGILNNDDLETVRSGAPAYLLMIDGLITGSPDSATLHRSGATLNSTYAGVFVEDPARARLMTDKGLKYALTGFCLHSSRACGLKEMDYDGFAAAIERTGKGDVPFLYTLGASWAAWIQARKDDWAAIGDIARVEAIMKRVVALDEIYQDGGAHLYLGTLATLIPPATGGRPEEGKAHFERAIALSGGRNLMAKTLYAKQYARLMFDRPLHDRLLQEVLDADPHVPGHVLSNVLAQKEARALLEDADAYF